MKDIKLLMENYKYRVVEFNSLLRKIQEAENKITDKKEELTKSIVPTLSDMPKGSGGKSDPTCETVIRWDEDKDIRRWEEDIKHLEARISELDAENRDIEGLLGILSSEERDIITAIYITGEDYSVIADRHRLSRLYTRKDKRRMILKKMQELYDFYYK